MPVLLIACGATFLAFLDVTVVNLAFPDLARDFPGSSVTELSWVITAYAVLFAALLTPAGRVADRVGRHRVLLGGVAFFTLASLASALAPSVGALVAARAVQGAAAAAMIPAALGVVLAETPPERRSAAIGLWGAAGAMAAAAGPTIGGLLVDGLGWRSVFFVNLPLGLAIVLRGAVLIPRTQGHGGRVPDVVGTLAVVSGIALVVLGVSQAADWGWGSPATVASLAGGALLVAVALGRSSVHPAPAVETSLWNSRVFAAANVVSLLMGAAIYAWMLVGVLFTTAVWHYSELQAGLAMTPGALSAAVAAVAAGRYADIRGQRAAVIGGALLLAFDGLWIVAVLPEQPNFLAFWLPAGLVSGIAMGAAMTGVSSAAAGAIDPVRFAAGAGLNMTARQLGGALGIAVLAAILQAQGGRDLDGYAAVYGMCGLAAAGAALSALRLRAPRIRPAPAAVARGEAS
jgi:EmrB/QacA subfamily drug resistance transporter